MKNSKEKQKKEPFEALFSSAVKYFRWIAAAAVLVILLTGIYKVDSNEVAVVLRFGALTGSSSEEQLKQPGLHFALPNFIDEVVKIPVEKVQELSVTTLYTASKTVTGSVQKTGYVLTGDSNVVLMKVMVKYKISDPVTYALYVSDADSALSGIITNTLTAIVSESSVDEVLITEKSAIASKAMFNAQSAINAVRLGVQLTNIELTDITPSNEAIDAFNEATTAGVKKQTLIQEANDYLARVIPEAEASAQTLIDTATADRSGRIAEATAVAEEFGGLYDQFIANPEVVKNSVFRMRLSSLISKSGAVIVIPDGEGSKVVLP